MSTVVSIKGKERKRWRVTILCEIQREVGGYLLHEDKLMMRRELEFFLSDERRGKYVTFSRESCVMR